MSLLEKVTMPFRFVENEFEALVGSMYQSYHNRFGKDQYSLSNLYLDGGFLYQWAPSIMTDFPSVLNAAGLAGAGACIWAGHYMNNVAKQHDSDGIQNAETAKNEIREHLRSLTKSGGRAFLVIAIDNTLDATLGYSLQRLTGTRDLNPSLYAYFNRHAFHLLALGYYTSSIDINNPKKSKIAAKVREWFKLGTPQKADELPQEGFMAGSRL